MNRPGQVLDPENLERLQSVLLDLLDVFDRICGELDLPYWIDGGSCLGAMRHGGFIPWDDDADVGMPYEAWKCFVREAPSVLPTGYTVHTWDNTPGMAPLWATLGKDGTRFVGADQLQSGYEQSIFLDIFPHVVLDADPGIAARQRRRMQFWQGLSYVREIKNPSGARGVVKALSAPAHAVLGLVPQHVLAKYYLASFDSDNPGDLLVNASYARVTPAPVDAVLPVRRVSFGPLELCAPRDPDTYLTLTYGDWRQLPPVEKRRTHAPHVLDFGDGVNVLEEGPEEEKA